jgi:hypothetical protein
VHALGGLSTTLVDVVFTWVALALGDRRIPIWPSGSCETAIACLFIKIAFDSAEIFLMSLPIINGDAEMHHIAI